MSANEKNPEAQQALAAGTTAPGDDPGDQEEIAVIGLACRLPGARDIAELWRNLAGGVEAITFFTDEELEAEGYPRHLLADPGFVRAKGVVEDADLFDAEFFGFTPREAEIMDPQQRIFLECAWEACEIAGYNPLAYPGKIGAYGGMGFPTYLTTNIMSNEELYSGSGGLQVRLFNDKDFLTTHVSYKLNLRGPSMAVQTACSTALTATHLACQALLEGECDMALAGGVTVSFPKVRGYMYQEGGILSPDGHCRAFDAAAQGTVEGNGAGVVLLKRLGDAQADGDTIWAVIRGSATNNDGSQKAGFTAPSVESQSRVIAEALAVARVDPRTIRLVEAHGSATPLGDPIEVESLTRAFRTAETGFCALGSVKSNIGHTDCAAGAASLIKAVLAVRHGQIPPSLHFHQANPQLHLERSPFYVSSRLAAWPEGPAPRRASVNSLGIGGTNVHVVLEQAPALPKPVPSRPWQLVVVSARSPKALEAATAKLARHLAEEAQATAAGESGANGASGRSGALPAPSLADIAHTLRAGRRAFRHRRALLCRQGDGLAEVAAALAPLAESAAGILGDAESGGAESRPVAFLLPGIGEQIPGATAELYRLEPAFRAAIDKCAGLLAAHSRGGFDLLGALYPGGSPGGRPAPSEGFGAPTHRTDLRRLLAAPRQDEASRQLHRTATAHPAVFALEYALAQLWLEWGVKPGAMLGYSLGEYVAACLSGVFSLEGALDLVVARARLIDDLPGGAMLAVPLPAAEVEPLLAGWQRLALSAANGPALSVVGGPEEEVAELERQLGSRGVSCRRLPTTHAFHTPMLEPIVDELTRVASGLKLAAPRVPFVSNVTGRWITAAEATDPAYWARHLCRTVRFSEGMETLLSGDSRLLVEVGPGQTLGTLARQHPARQGGQVTVASLPGAGEEVSEQAFLLDALARLWVAGAAPDWSGFGRHERRRRVPLPTYPFERRRYFVEAQVGEAAAKAAPAGRRPDLADWLYAPVWERAPASSTPLDGARPGGSAAGGPWLVFLDGPAAAAPQAEGLGARLAGLLEARSETVYRVARGEEGSGLVSHGRGAFTLDPEEAAGYRRLFQELRQQGGLPRRIADLWSLGAAGAPPLAEADIAAAGFYRLLRLAQAIGELEGRGPTHLAVVADGLFEVTGEEKLSPARAALLGPCRVLPQETPGITCSAIDLVPAAGAGLPALAARLAEEIGLPDAGRGEAVEPVVALRGRHRWVRRFRPVRLPAPDAPGARLRRGGVYLVTDALGEAGLAIAEHLFRTAGARLALLTGPETPRSMWAEWLSEYDEANDLSRRIRRVLALEAGGCEVLTMAYDLTQPASVHEAVSAVVARFGTLHGVIHTAGGIGGGMLQWKTAEAADEVIAPKVLGTALLAEATRSLALDLFVLFGSHLAATGGFGQSDAVAASSFLDAFAQARAGQAPFTLAIDWGYFKWQPVLVADPTFAEQLRAYLDATGIGTAECAQVLDRAMASSLPQVVVSTMDLARAMADANTPPIQLTGGTPTALAGTHPRPELPSAYSAPEGEVEQTVARIWQEAFGIDQIGRHDNFFDLAGNSLLALQIVSRLTSAFKTETSLATLLESPTVAELAARLRPAAEAAEESAGTDAAAPAATDMSEMERLLAAIEALSPEEAAARLGGGEPAPGPAAEGL